MFKNGIKPKVLLIDPLAADKNHLFDDDLFLTECIAPLTDDFLVMSSPSSVENINRKLKTAVKTIPLNGQKNKLIRLNLITIAITLPCSGIDDIVFQSFEEVSTLLMMILHPHKRVHLITTSNLRPDRIKRHPILGPFFLRTVFKLAASVIVHCQYEVNKIIELVPDIDPTKIYIKPFHQIMFNRVRLSWQQKSRMILFVGPESAHKKIEHVINLIINDKKRRFSYTFCSMQTNLLPQTRSFLETQKNVKVLYDLQEDDIYHRLISEAFLIILTHNNNFEGALSGVFCDAIASGTPIIAQDMAPHNEFFERFGPMGFLVDYADPMWHKKVLDKNLVETYTDFQQNMAKCREYCGMENIRKVFKTVLKIK